MELEFGQGGIVVLVIPSNINTTLFIVGRRKGSSWIHQNATLTMFSMTFLSMISHGTNLFNSPEIHLQIIEGNITLYFKNLNTNLIN